MQYLICIQIVCKDYQQMTEELGVEIVFQMHCLNMYSVCVGGGGVQKEI